MKNKNVFFWNLLRAPVCSFFKIRFGLQSEMAKDLPSQYMVISNHLTDYDAFLVASSFKKHMYFVMSEHVMRWKVVSFFLYHIVNPIFRMKGAPATSAIMEVMKRMKQGANVCLFAEGVRSWDGRTCPIAPATAKLVKSVGCGLVTYKLTGGYFASPMWSGASIRRGKMHGAPVRVYTKEELAAMTNEEVYEAIVRDLYEDAYETQSKEPIAYKGKELAKGLENLMFICPKCGKRDVFVSSGDSVICQKCGVTYNYNKYGKLERAPFETLRELSDWQKEQVKKDVEDGVVYTAAKASVKTVKKHEETPIDAGEVVFSPTSLRCGKLEIPMEEINELAMHGQRAIVFSANKEYYELIPEKGYNAYKFFLYYEELKRQKKG